MECQINLEVDQQIAGTVYERKGGGGEWKAGRGRRWGVVGERGREIGIGVVPARFDEVYSERSLRVGVCFLDARVEYRG